MKFSSVELFAICALALFFGEWLEQKFAFIKKYCLPKPVLAGLGLALLVFAIEKMTGLNLEFDFAPQTPLMVAFFATLGFAASWKQLRMGGKAVIHFLLLCIGLLLLQNLIGIGVALGLGESPLFGVMVSSVSLVGGPGTSLAFAPLFEESGLQGAASIGLASAMGGIFLAGLWGGPVSAFLIRRNNLQNNGELIGLSENSDHEKLSMKFTESGLVWSLFKSFGIIFLVMMVGGWVSQGLIAVGLTLPGYIGAMIAASFVRNLDDYKGIFKLNVNFLEVLGSMALSFFIVMSLLAIDWSKLSGLAGPLLISLSIQGIVIMLISIWVIFPMMGKDYDSAVIAGGTVGFMLGTTANAMANMQAVTKQFGSTTRAFLVVPLVGACFIDFVNAAVISILVNYLK
ncbi:MAG: sodium/glutamate symporter [Pseudobdellovibrionaceae bacterium]